MIIPDVTEGTATPAAEISTPGETTKTPEETAQSGEFGLFEDGKSPDSVEVAAEIRDGGSTENADPTPEVTPEQKPSVSDAALAMARTQRALLQRDAENIEMQQRLKQQSADLEAYASLKSRMGSDPLAVFEEMGGDFQKAGAQFLGRSEEVSDTDKKLAELRQLYETIEKKHETFEKKQTDYVSNQKMVGEYTQIYQAIDSVTEQAPTIAAMAMKDPVAVAAEILKSTDEFTQKNGYRPEYSAVATALEESLQPAIEADIERYLKIPKYRDKFLKAVQVMNNEPKKASGNNGTTNGSLTSASVGESPVRTSGNLTEEDRFALGKKILEAGWA